VLDVGVHCVDLSRPVRFAVQSRISVTLWRKWRAPHHFGKLCPRLGFHDDVGISQFSSIHIASNRSANAKGPQTTLDVESTRNAFAFVLYLTYWIELGTVLCLRLWYFAF
jgi:hypothetical protein